MIKVGDSFEEISRIPAWAGTAHSLQAGLYDHDDRV
jgi:hypothetical protein